MTEQDNFGRLTQAMALLGDTLAPFVERELKRAGQGWWTNSVLPNVSRLTRQKLPSLPKKGVNGQLGVLDVADLLSLITKTFSVAFRNRLPDSARSYAEELRSARTTWAHKPSSGDIDAAVADRAIDTAALLLDSIEPAAAAAIRLLKDQPLGWASRGVERERRRKCYSQVRPVPACDVNGHAETRNGDGHSGARGDRGNGGCNFQGERMLHGACCWRLGPSRPGPSEGLA